MKPSFPSTSPSSFSHQNTPSQSEGPGDMTKKRTPHDSRESSERFMQKFSRSSDEGRSSRRNSRSRPSSVSSLFAQQNVTLEKIPASKRLSRSGSPALLASSTVSTSRSATATTLPLSKSPVRSVAHQAASQQSKVEDDLERVSQRLKPVEHPLQIPMGVGKPHAELSTPTIDAAPAQWSCRPLASPKPGRPRTVCVDDENSKVSYSLASPSSTKASLNSARPQARIAIDNSQSTDARSHQTDLATPAAPSATSPPSSPDLYRKSPHYYLPGYAAALPPLDSPQPSTASPPPQAMPPMSYGYVPMVTTGPAPSIYGNHYYGMPFSPSAEQAMTNSEGPGSLGSVEDGHQQLLDKIAIVLPDINRLLDKYKGNSGQVPPKQPREEQAGLSHHEQLSKVKVELEATKKEYEKVIQRLVDERYKIQQELVDTRRRAIELDKAQSESKALRVEVESLQAHKKEVTEGLDGIRRSKEEMQTLKLANEQQIDFLKSSLQAEKDLHHRNVTDAKEQARNQIDLKHKELRKTVNDQRLNYSKIQMELTSLLSRHSNQQKELDAVRSSETDCKIKLDLKCKESENTLVKHAQDIQSLKKKYEDDRERMAQETAERSITIDQQHAAKEKQWEQDLHNTRAELELERAESQRLQDEIKKVEKTKEAESVQKFAELIEILAVWRVKSDDLHREGQNLCRVLQGLGDSIQAKNTEEEHP